MLEGTSGGPLFPPPAQSGATLKVSQVAGGLVQLNFEGLQGWRETPQPHWAPTSLLHHAPGALSIHWKI